MSLLDLVNILHTWDAQRWKQDYRASSQSREPWEAKGFHLKHNKCLRDEKKEMKNNSMTCQRKGCEDSCKALGDIVDASMDQYIREVSFIKYSELLIEAHVPAHYPFNENQRQRFRHCT